MHLYVVKQNTMKRKDFLSSTIAAIPALALGQGTGQQLRNKSTGKAFVIAAGKSRFGDVQLFKGIHPNDLKISSKDTDGQLSVFEYTGLEKTGPALHVHFYQDEIFIVAEGVYRFVVGEETYQLTAGQTIFLPRNIPHTWIQLTEKGKLIYFLQPAGKMEEFFTIMSSLKGSPSQAEIDKIHSDHGMKLMGPPLTL